MLVLVVVLPMFDIEMTLTALWALPGILAILLTGLAAAFHGFVRSRMLNWPGGSMRPRPVHLNTWEAVYFDHEMDRLTALADRVLLMEAGRLVEQGTHEELLQLDGRYARLWQTQSTNENGG